MNFQSLLFLNDKTFGGLRLNVYVLIKILKFCTNAPVKSYQVKYAISQVVANRDIAGEEVGKAIQDVIHFHTLRGKFSSVHPKLREEGIVKVEVLEEGLHFVREKGWCILCLINAKN